MYVKIIRCSISTNVYNDGHVCCHDVNITDFFRVILMRDTSDFLCSSTLMYCLCPHVQDALTDPQRVRTPDITEYWKPLAEDVSIYYLQTALPIIFSSCFELSQSST